MVLLALLMFGLAAGRVWGIDARLRRRLGASRGFGRLLWWLA